MTKYGMKFIINTVLPLMSDVKFPYRFCQFTTEIHFPVEIYGLTMEMYQKMLRNFILNSFYLPVWFEAPKGGLPKAFFIDILSENCAEKFFRPADDFQCF